MAGPPQEVTRRRARYRRRKAIVEPVIGSIKEALGFRRFSLRGVAKARSEWNHRVSRRERQAPPIEWGSPNPEGM